MARKAVAGEARTAAAQPVSARKSTPKPPAKRSDSAPKPAKVTRKGRPPTTGAQIIREYARVKDSFDVKLLVNQAARVADRLEQVARVLSGDPDAWLGVRVVGQVLKLDVSPLVQEERQLSEVLRKLIMSIEKLRGDEGGKGKDGDPKPVDPVAAIVQRHYGKRA